MMRLSQTEQRDFVEFCKRKALSGKTAVEEPRFVSLLGAKGAGKTTLGRRLENTVLISADDVICDYFRRLNVDARNYAYDREESRFFTETINEIFVAAIRGRRNIAYDTGLTDNTEELIRRMKQKNYHTEIKAVLVDDIVAQLNVAERKLNFDRRFSDYQKGLGPYPEEMNPTAVGLKLAAKSATDTAEFLMTTDEPFEVFEYGSDRPAYDSRTAREPFADYLEKFCARLPDKEIYRERLKSLYENSREQKNFRIEKELNDLHLALYGRGLRRQQSKTGSAAGHRSYIAQAGIAGR